MPDGDEESAPSPEEAAEIMFLEEHAEDDTMTLAEEEAIKKDEEAIKKDNPGSVLDDVS
jgi:hypothetical protein